jgi:hypothetical protein
MTDPWKVELPKPISAGGKTFEVLELREPTAGEMLRANKHAAQEADMALLADVLGVPAAFEALAAVLTGRQLRQALEKMKPALEIFEQIGKGTLLPAGVATDDDLPETLTIPLPETIALGTTWVDKLELHEPNGLDILKFRRDGGGNLSSLIVLVALASSQPRAVIERVPISLFSRAAAYALAFTLGVPQGGNSSSDA